MKTVENKLNHDEDWDFYMSYVDGIIGSFLIDLGLINIVPIEDKPNVVWISINIQNPLENGLLSNEESETFYAIEDNIVDDIANQHNAIFVGRLTSDGKRQLYFYFDDTLGYDKTINHAMLKYPTYEFDFGSKEDVEWDVYLNFLYPLPNQYQMIMNDRVIRQLEQSGDNLSKERMVDHAIYFKTENDMENFISEIEKENFTVIASHQTEEKDYFLNVGRVDKVDYESVNDYVLYLWELAGKYNGDYTGWGCEVEKD
ncbi:MAG: DUF695 domain-containing protein [Methanobrevibacter sp.]|nr:DUF695 domain-containing protein [Methanobrevibacter sp.]